MNSVAGPREITSRHNQHFLRKKFHCYVVLLLIEIEYKGSRAALRGRPQLSVGTKKGQSQTLGCESPLQQSPDTDLHGAQT